MESLYTDFFSSLKTKTILVIGDVMVDAYLWGKVDRISPEAPVPVVAVRKRENRLGGAANVALNIKAMGAEAILLSVVGDDVKGREFAALLEQAGLPSDGMIYSADRITTTKFRVIGNKVQLLRVDEESEEALNPREEEAISRRFSDLIGKQRIDAIVFQDYDKGVINPGLIRTVMKAAHQAGIPVAVDPKKKNFFEYKGVRLFKPNLKELREGLKLDQAPEGEKMEEAVSRLQAELQADIVMAVS
jgi:rfaE bifunctional protein kinase chain/domain